MSQMNAYEQLVSLILKTEKRCPRILVRRYSLNRSEIDWCLSKLPGEAGSVQHEIKTRNFPTTDLVEEFALARRKRKPDDPRPLELNADRYSKAPLRMERSVLFSFTSIVWTNSYGLFYGECRQEVIGGSGYICAFNAEKDDSARLIQQQVWAA